MSSIPGCIWNLFCSEEGTRRLLTPCKGARACRYRVLQLCQNDPRPFGRDSAGSWATAGAQEYPQNPNRAQRAIGHHYTVCIRVYIYIYRGIVNHHYTIFIIQWTLDISRSTKDTVLQKLTKYCPQLAGEGELWGVFCECNARTFSFNMGFVVWCYIVRRIKESTLYLKSMRSCVAYSILCNDPK